MATHQQPSPTAAMTSHHGHTSTHVQVNGHATIPGQSKTAVQVLREINDTWLSLLLFPNQRVGNLSELLGDIDGAIHCYEAALRHNPWSIPALLATANILRGKDQFPTAVEYLRTILKSEPTNGEVWGSLGHCYLMMDNLQEAYSAYQQALYHLQDPKEPKLWYGIGILYDRYGSLEHAEEAFSQVMRMEPNFEKANEIYFRLGIIYKQQQKFQQSLECFQYIVKNPPRPLTEEDIWFQIGHVYEQQKDYEAAKAAYKRVLDRDPTHAKVLQQLGWLHHQQSTSFASQEQAIEYLEKSVSSDTNDAQSWYLLGRCYMSQQKYPKAYEAYQQAVYRDGRNPTFWCSIGVLYYQINQYRDALDAYSRAIRLNPNISEVWYDLGTLYESCNNQTADALDAYQRAADLDPTNVHITARLRLLQNGQAQNGMPNQNSAPMPQDVHPQAYQPGAMNGPPGPQWGASAPSQPPQGPLPPALGSGSSDWPRPLAGIREVPPPQAPQHPYEHRDAPRPPTQHPAPRPGSPRQEPIRQFQEPARPATAAPPPPRRGLSPSPSSHNSGQGLYQGSQSLPPQAHPSQPPLSQSQPPQNRITNPNYGPHSSSVASLPPTVNGPPAPGPLPPYNRMTSPPPEVRPILENRPGSASGAYPSQSFQHHSNPPSAGGIANGAPPPASALAAAEAAAREREDRTSAPKRLREWEEDSTMSQKQPADEKRARLEEPQGRRPSPPPRVMASPPHRSPPDADHRRLDEQRRIPDVYHPSDAAHHPASLPSIGAVPQPQPTPKEERLEPAARQVDVDEDYSDGGEDEKRNIPPKSERGSPRSANPLNGVPHPPTPLETKS